METENQPRIWVSIEILKATNSVCMRGSMLESDFDQIVAGTFGPKFVKIKDAHWTTTVNVNHKNGIKFVSHGKDGEWKWHTGEYLIVVERIIGIALLKDVSAILNSDVDIVFESNL